MGRTATCERPWNEVWKTHSYEVKRNRYYAICDFLLVHGDANGSTNVDPDADSDADADAEIASIEEPLKKRAKTAPSATSSLLSTAMAALSP
jgi:hypothetical protein